MNKRFRRVSSAALSLLLIASPVSPLLHTLPVLAEETELAESYTFDGTASTRVSITDQLPAYGEADTMIWSGTFQANASNNAIVALMSVCGNDNANDYMTLYVRPGTNKIGFEFRKVTGASYKVSQEANLQVGTDKHEFELVVSSKGYFLTVDGEELIASRQSGALTLMNCGYTDLRMTLGGMDRTGKSSMSDNWFFNGTMTNVAVKLEQRDVLPEAFAEISGGHFPGKQQRRRLHAYRKSEIGRCFDDLYARYDRRFPPASDHGQRNRTVRKSRLSGGHAVHWRRSYRRCELYEHRRFRCPRRAGGQSDRTAVVFKQSDAN